MTSPVRVPAGGTSSTPVTPRSAMVAMQRSQRTGAATWLTIRASTSRPSWTTAPSRFDSSRVRGSWVVTAPASRPRTSTAGAMCSVWNAPATSSGRSRAPSGGSACRAASCSRVPAATIWPAPFSLAAVSPCSASLATTASRSPPRTAVMPVGRAAAASAIARPRSRTRTMACSALITWAPAAAVISPTECPAPTPTTPKASAGEREQLEQRHQTGGDDERLGHRGVADGLGVGLGAVGREVHAGAGGQPVQPGPDGRQLEPRGEEAGGLGALSGGDDGEHPSTLGHRWDPTGCRRRRRSRTIFGGFLQLLEPRPAGRTRAPAAARTRPVASVGTKPVTSAIRRSRYRTVFGCTNNGRAAPSMDRPSSR